MNEHRVPEGEGPCGPVIECEMAKLGVARGELSGGRSEPAKPCELSDGEPCDGQPSGSERRKPPGEAVTGPCGAGGDEHDVGGPELEREAFKGQRGASARQFRDAPDLPSVERCVDHGHVRRVDEEDPGVTSSRTGFEHKNGGQ